MKKYFALSTLLVILKRLFKNSSFNILIIIFFSMLISSCAGNRVVSIPIPTDLISKSRVTEPIVENAIRIVVRENRQIRPVFKLEESMQSALQNALNYSNIFGHDSSRPFEIVVNVLEWYQPSGDFGMFDCTMTAHYVLFDEDKNIIFDDKITTEAYSDTWFFEGFKRAKRAAIMNVAKNVNQFVDILKSNLETRSSSTVKGKISGSGKHQFFNRKSEITNKSSLLEELKNLSELHSSGILTDQEFHKAKEKLLR